MKIVIFEHLFHASVIAPDWSKARNVYTFVIYNRSNPAKRSLMVLSYSALLFEAISTSLLIFHLGGFIIFRVNEQVGIKWFLESHWVRFRFVCAGMWIRC